MKQALFVLSEFDKIYGGEVCEAIKQIADVAHEPVTADYAKQNPDILRGCELLFTGWGAPVLDGAFLEHAPNLKAVFYGAGSIRYMVTDAFWQKNIPITSAWRILADPVAEVTAALIVLCLKQYFKLTARFMESHSHQKAKELTFPGLYEGVAGLVSLGAVGERAARRLSNIGVKTIAYDPFASRERADELGIRLVGLEELFAKADIVSLHTPWLPETVGMIHKGLLNTMKQGAVLINTSRGAVINEADLIETLTERPDLYAYLDVTYPEPPADDSPLWNLPNVTLSPHLAGSLGTEARRQGWGMLEECRRFLNGEPLLHQITKERAAIMA